MNENIKQSRKQFTKKQHYIPQMILKRFMNTQVPICKPIIYQYDKEKDIERQRTNVDDICCEKKLYEIRGENGDISEEERNLIENSFSKLESKWNAIINKIEKKQDISKEERDMLALLLVLQLIRTPEVIKITKEWLNNACIKINKTLTQNEIDRYSKLASFVWGVIDPKTNWILYELLEKFLTGKELVVFHTNGDFVINGNRPVFLLIELNSKEKQDCQLIMPISKKYCISLTDKKTSLYVEINDAETDCINSAFFNNDGRFICASNSIETRLDKLKNIVSLKEINNANN